MKTNDSSVLGKSLATSGLRFTRQRRRIYDVLLEKRDHPTAEDVFQRAKRKMPEISFATVYNCLDTLVKCDLVKQVNLDRAPTRYCPNMQEHSHFHCEQCGSILDIDYLPDQKPNQVSLPKGFKVNGLQLTVHGVCPSCSGK